MRMRVPARFHWRRLGLLLGGLVVGCGEDATGPRPVPAAVVVVGGESQLGTVGETLDTALTVRVTDKFGEPVPGALVRFSVGVRSGSLTPITQTTGPGGHAAARWTLPKSAGVLRAIARVSGLDSLIFHAVARPASPASLSLISGDLQSAATQSVLPETVVVQVRDGFGNPVAGTPVSFLPTDGSGIAEPSAARADSSGLALTRWTLGEAPGVHALIVRVDTLPTLRVRAHALLRVTSPAYGVTLYSGGMVGDDGPLPQSGGDPRPSPRTSASLTALPCWRNALGSAPLLVDAGGTGARVEAEVREGQCLEPLSF